MCRMLMTHHHYPRIKFLLNEKNAFLRRKQFIFQNEQIIKHLHRQIFTTVFTSLYSYERKCLLLPDRC